ncbi:MAG: hypothetical protein H0T76_08365 [Nannocystis sp.]|nr:hypothetical protein [Nannocystis sp.]MBA3546480.1 hypothetical protein [Nannocystis sp.]
MKVLTVYRARAELLRRLAIIAGLLIAYSAMTAALYHGLRPEHAAPAINIMRSSAPPTRNVSVASDRFFVDGEPFFIKAVGWDPTRPGELPWTRRLDLDEVGEDFRRIRAAGFNVIRTWAPMRPEELALALQHGLRVLQGVWVAPDGDFADPSFRRQALADVARAVESSRHSEAVLGYLVLNEPRAEAVARAGLDGTQAFLREVVATVRALDPAAPIGYASWPGLEALDDDLLDFVAFNLYPHRPRVVMTELGLAAYTKMVRETIARGRPLIISEFGLSVSPGLPLATPGRGGSSPEEQAQELVALAETFTSAGAAGLAVFQWSDGWWKNNDGPGDALSQDPMDPEEWFGLVQFVDADDRRGTPRPALAALQSHQRAVLLEPRSGAAAPEEIAVRLHAEEEIGIDVRIDGGAAIAVPLQRTCSTCYEGLLRLPPMDGRFELAFDVLDASGVVIRSERRLLRRGGAPTTDLELSPGRITVTPGEAFTVALRTTAAGEPVASSVTIAAYSEDEFYEHRYQLNTGAGGRIEASFVAPMRTTLMTIVAFGDDPALPPSERSARWTVVEVREGT